MALTEVTAMTAATARSSRVRRSVHPRSAAASSGRLLSGRRRFGGGADDDDAESPAHARLARLHHRAMRLERRIQRREEGRRPDQERHQRRLDQQQQRKSSMKTAEKPETNIPHEVYEDSENYRLSLVIPGYGPSSLTVTVGPFGHVLRINGRKPTGLAKSKENNQDNHFKTAFKTKGKFDTSKLPDAAKAVLSNGILHVSIPKDPMYGQATPVAVSEAVVVPAVAVAAGGAETDVGFELVDDEFVSVKKATPMTNSSNAKVPIGVASDDEDGLDEEECVEEDMDDDDDDDEDVNEQEEDKKKPSGGDNNKMFRRLVEVPGVRLEDLTVEHECEGRILRVTGIRRAGGLTGHKKDKSFQKTFRLRPFQRGIDIANLTATLDHGVLCITAPRTNNEGKLSRTKNRGTAPERFCIPVTTTDGTEGEDDIVAGFECIDLAKSKTTK